MRIRQGNSFHYCIMNHPPRHRIDRRLSNRHGKARFGDFTDTFTAFDDDYRVHTFRIPNSPFSIYRYFRPDLRSVRDVRIVACILDD